MKSYIRTFNVFFTDEQAFQGRPKSSSYDQGASVPEVHARMLYYLHQEVLRSVVFVGWFVRSLVSLHQPLTAIAGVRLCARLAQMTPYNHFIPSS